MKDNLIFKIFAHETRETLREKDPEDSWDAGDEEVFVTFTGSTICDDKCESGMNAHRVFTQKYDSEEFKIDWNYNKDNIFLVIARFQTGSTFGFTKGEWCVEFAYETFKEAEKCKKDNYDYIERKHSDYFGGLEDIEIINVPFERS